jgi:hypothetical protein
VRGLLIHAELGSPQISAHLHWLGRQRGILGTQEFQRLLTEHLSPEDIATVMGWLEQPD